MRRAWFSLAAVLACACGSEGDTLVASYNARYEAANGSDSPVTPTERPRNAVCARAAACAKRSASNSAQVESAIGACESGAEIDQCCQFVFNAYRKVAEAQQMSCD